MTAPAAPPAPAPTPTPYRRPRPPESAVPPDLLDLWLIRSPAEAGRLDLSVLDAAERARAEGFLRPADGLLYAAAHIGLRRLLARYTGQPPEELRFAREPCPGCGKPHGRPMLARPPGDASPPLHFSLSHSSGVALVGVAAVPVGVDVERLPREETAAICTPALHPDERAELEAAPPHARRAAFGRLWTRKEAYLKGIGTGLSRGPAQDYLGERTGAHPPGWTVLGIPCFPTHVAAAAVRHPAPAEAGVRCVPGPWLDASDSWRTPDLPRSVRVDVPTGPGRTPHDEGKDVTG
ncbi:4'-phosphopantetheinyl transferase family protein [Streptomyces sp. NPDC001606]